MPHQGACLLSIATASPPSIDQQRTAQLAAQRMALNPQESARLERLFLRCGIERRGSVLAGGPDDSDIRAFYPPTAACAPTTQLRMERYAQEAPRLALSAASQALADTGIGITHLITVSCTGFMAPGLDAALIEGLKLSPRVQRLHLGFMGCHGAFNALAAASDAIRGNPNTRALVCCVELPSLHFRYGSDPGQLIANALFADGAAAAILTPPEKSPAPLTLCASTSHLVPGTQEAMTWRIGNQGFEMTLSPQLPSLIAAHIRPWCESWLAEHHLTLGDIAHWAIHPGGPKILASIAEALSLPPEALSLSRRVLAEHGNMSSATILFILRHILEGARPGPCVAIGLGPGLMIEGLLLRRG